MGHHFRHHLPADWMAGILRVVRLHGHDRQDPVLHFPDLAGTCDTRRDRHPAFVLGPWPGGSRPDSFIDDLLVRVDIVEVIERRLPLKRAGREWMACCPFHDERSPSFSVSPTKQFYHCFGCGAHGSAIKFLMEYD